MKKLERMNAIIYILKEKGRVNANEMAALLEVSERTVYRDIDALSQIKVPIITYEGNQGGYELDSGFFIPTLRLSEDEITNFLILLKLGKELKIPGLYKQYDMLSYKLFNAIARDSRPGLVRFLDKFKVYINRINPVDYEEGILEIIIESLMEDKKLKITYYTPLSNSVTVREVSPCRFLFDEGGWYLTAYCHLRKEKRTFRLDRIRRIRLLEDKCSFPAGFMDTTENMLRPYLLQMDRNFYELIKHNYYMDDHIIVQDSDNLTVELHTDSEDLILELALKNPAMVKLLAPENTRERIKSLAQELERIYG